MADYSYKLRIPLERVAVLIGKSGETKKQLEEATKVRINVDSKEGDVEISGNEPIILYNTLEAIRAIGRGFNPDIALLLLKPDYGLEIMNLNEFAPTKNAMLRLKGRVIGMEGKSRRVIEDLTECFISVYGKTISIIGPVEYAGIARKAVMSLLGGSMHSNVFKWLEKQRRMKRIGPDIAADTLGVKESNPAKE